MAGGTPGFSGQRLQEAREARGLSAVTMAEILGVTRQLIYEYESDEVAPPPDKLYIIAAKLGVPVGFFVQQPRPSAETTVFYRSLASATKPARSKAEARLRWLGDIVEYLAAFVEFPLADFPDLPMSRRIPLPMSEIEEAAKATRRHWALGDGPISNVVWLLESKGAVGTRGIIETETIDAFSTWMGEPTRPCLFLGADKDSAARSRFDAAHELAHAVIHRRVRRSQLSGGAEHKAIEADANRFASAFLLPAASFPFDLRAPSLQAMVIAKARWVVSVGAMIHRLADLDAITEDEAARLWIARSRRHWAKHEPLDDELPPEQPRSLSSAIMLVINEGVRTKDQICSELVREPADIECLAGLPAGYFGNEPAPLRLVDRLSPVSRSAGEPGEIVHFPR